MELKCDGSCEEHIGEVKPVIVWGQSWTKDNPWKFNYCEEAIREDERRGFIVEPINEENEDDYGY